MKATEATITCNRCQLSHVETFDRVVDNGFVRAEMSLRGWISDGDTDTCPTCQLQDLYE